MDYFPPTAGKPGTMRSGKSEGVCLVIANDHTFVREVLRGAMQRLRGAHTPVTYLPNFGLLKRCPASVRGIVLSLGQAEWVDRLRKLHRPVVNVSTFLPPTLVPSVVTDNRAIGRMAAEHFWDRGYRNFAYLGISGEYLFYDRERLAGFAEGVAERGRQCEEVLRADRPVEIPAVPRFKGALRGQPFHEAVPAAVADERKREILEWLARTPKPVGVLAANDVPATELLAICAEAGVDVPAEVGVLGVGNDAVYCEVSSPPLSSIDQNAVQIGYQAASLMLRLLGGEPPPEGPVLIAPRRVVVRESAGTAVAGNSTVSGILNFIWENAQRLRSVQDLCAEFPMSRRSLELLFEKHVGHGPAKEILRARVEHAKTLLAETDETLKAISAALGFRSLCHFVYVFRRQTGLTPGEYRAQNRLR